MTSSKFVFIQIHNRQWFSCRLFWGQRSYEPRTRCHEGWGQTKAFYSWTCGSVQFRLIWYGYICQWKEISWGWSTAQIPNFNQWIWWVKDYVGPYHQKPSYGVVFSQDWQGRVNFLTIDIVFIFNKLQSQSLLINAMNIVPLLSRLLYFITHPSDPVLVIKTPTGLRKINWRHY